MPGAGSSTGAAVLALGLGLVVHWFRTAIDFFFSGDAKEISDSYAVVTETFSGGREEWVDDVGRVASRHEGRGGTHTGLSAALLVGDRIADPAFCARLLDFLANALDGANPVFARVDHLNFQDTPDLEAALRRTHRKYLSESRTHLRGYSWITGVPAEIAARLGGAQRLSATGAFHEVRELPGGGLLLQAIETLAGYGDRAMREVFRALAPVLPPGIPEHDPARPDLRVVFEDASGV
ncbi:hypothetical protein ACIBVL_10585 [Streptomyces sp. NPDC049687]|uniref:hypothetical protein n=1 Tax=Streptomyces sp. NPDC049687 TaxID=3365596 RepID=UPI00378C81DF